MNQFQIFGMLSVVKLINHKMSCHTRELQHVPAKLKINLVKLKTGTTEVVVKL